MTCLERIIPIVLSKDEVKSVIGIVGNLKQKVIFSTIYSAGLRLEETLNLKPAAIDSANMLIRIHKGKGKNLTVS